MRLKVRGALLTAVFEQDSPEGLALYSHKNCADDIKELARQLGSSRIILGGHDWYVVLLFFPGRHGQTDML